MNTQNGKFVRRLVLTGIVAAVYTVMTLGLGFISYGPVQFRLSELLNLLAFVNPIFAPGVILGCFIANFMGSAIPFDWLFGTLATALALFCITRTKRLIVAAMWPVLFSGVIVGAMLTSYLTEPPFQLLSFLTFAGSVMAGQFVVVMLIGVQLFKYLMRNERLMVYFRGF